MFFRLLPEVYLVVGKNKSLLQNLVLKKCVWINSRLSDLIKKCENNRPIPWEHFNILKPLETEGWGKVTDTPIFIDKLRLNNVFNEKKFHKDSPMINFATIKLTNNCNLSCDKCNHLFCPTCFKKSGENSSFTLNKLKQLIYNLKFYGCKNINVTGGEAYLCSDFLNIYEFILENEINIIINTNGLIKFKNVLFETPICISLFDKSNLNKIIENFKDFKTVILLAFDVLKTKEKLKIPTQWTFRQATQGEPYIHKNNLVNMDINSFFARKDKNYCLNNKIAILENGDVYPCLGAWKRICAIGNIFYDDWNIIIKNLLQKYWLNNIDNKTKCKHCEFRYACNSCVFLDSEKSCFYDVEVGQWK